MIQLTKSKLIKQYTLYFALIFTLMGVMYFAISMSISKYYLEQVQTKLHINIATTIIQDFKIIEKQKLDSNAIKAAFNRYMLLNPHLELYLLDSKGNIIDYSADPKKIKRQKVSLQPINYFLSHQPLKSFPMGDDPRQANHTEPFSVAPLPNGGFLYVIIQSQIEKEANRQLQESILLKVSAVAFVVSAIIGFILGGLLFFHLTKRINDLSYSVTTFSKNRQIPIPPPKKLRDELDQLHLDIMTMSNELTEQMEHLSRIDQNRRFMISSLSHDLRTPLTNLLGYIEQTMQNYDDNNLKTAYQNGIKLKHYLDQIFEFSKLELPQKALNRQELSVNEFCNDIYIEYKNNNPSRDFKLQFDGLFIYKFDANQLERAVCNLLDNAIKYGTEDICLACAMTEQWLEISICNTGVQAFILPDLQKEFLLQPDNLFNLKTQAEQSHNPLPNYSGLGLTIVHSIVEKHNGQLVYRRKENSNCFVIRLPM
ncbi:HAMP domain-containing sensor histidine kinase [Thiomicrorhabdus sp.]|uniref:sensor histidine kinase n=1 Tax=Thiomicrorhabdus sp. TaxID=2039724 RepID=UPI002AA94342|nr:HAMP domain-containing sensor histidine kinase [Thiomicrorhabdus sp.]